MQAFNSEIAARLRMARAARTGLLERLSSFWGNQFAIGVSRHRSLYGMVGAYEREAIRPFLTGRFETMLLHVTRHPAMLLYLDNVRSIGPNSAEGRRRRRGINENHARELLELHTLGVTGGYNQADVTELALALTGWTIQRRLDAEDLGRFRFEPRMHEHGSRKVLGKEYESVGVAQGTEIISDLVRHPATAQHIAKRLAVAFVADQPAPSLVDRLALVFRDTEGDLGELTRSLILADEAWVGGAERLRSPLEFVLATARALEAEIEPRDFARTLEALGQRMWDPPSPKGFSIASGTWLAPNAFSDRLDYAQYASEKWASDKDPVALADDLFGEELTDETRTAVRRAGSRAQGLTLLLMSPEFQRRG